jgi:hypothetical protein
MPKVTVKCQDLGMKKILKGVKKLDGVSVETGIPEDAADYPNGTPVALVAAVHEYGTDTTPARPFIRPVLDGKGSKYASLSGGVGAAVLDGKKPDEALNKMGESISADIRDAARDQGLVNTGHLLESIGYRVHTEPVKDE